MNTIYIEKHVLHHPRTLRILERIGQQATIIECLHYGEIFNPKGQNFRIQKQNPALIIAEKKGELVLSTPEGFGIGGQQNYYFSHMLNCLYDCRYCFLQGMYQSANYVLFINYEDFMNEIATISTQHQQAYFFSGYDCDSLAFEPLTQFTAEFLPFFATQKNAILELRTKSTNINSLLKHQTINNCVVAFSFTPEKISEKVEHKVPKLIKRIEAMRKLALAGWKIGLRFDPLIYIENFNTHYQQLIDTIFQAITAEHIHSVSIGAMRFPMAMYQKLLKLYPWDELMTEPLVKRGSYCAYNEELEENMKNSVLHYLKKYLSETIIFECKN